MTCCNGGSKVAIARLHGEVLGVADLSTIITIVTIITIITLITLITISITIITIITIILLVHFYSYYYYYYYYYSHARVCMRASYCDMGPDGHSKPCNDLATPTTCAVRR